MNPFGWWPLSCFLLEILRASKTLQKLWTLKKHRVKQVKKLEKKEEAAENLHGHENQLIQQRSPPVHQEEPRHRYQQIQERSPDHQEDTDQLSRQLGKDLLQVTKKNLIKIVVDINRFSKDHLQFINSKVILKDKMKIQIIFPRKQ